MKKESEIKELIKECILKSNKSMARIAVESGVSISILYKLIDSGKGLSLANAEQMLKYFDYEIVKCR